MSSFLKNLHPLLRRKKDKNLNEDTNYILLNTLNEELNTVERDTIESKLQSSLKSATGTYLDKFGDWFGVYRKVDEEDDKYRQRIIKYLLLKRGTNNAIIEGIKYYLDRDDLNISIYEPFKNIFYTNKSELNGNDKLMGYYYRFAVINVTIGNYFPLEIIDIINEFKPAGVKLYVTYDGGATNNGSLIYQWLNGSMKVEMYEDITNFYGYDELLYGHINLGLRKTDSLNYKSVFINNKSLINSEDVLTGSSNVGRIFNNVSIKSSYNYTPQYNSSVANIISELKNKSEELSTDFYLHTNEKNNVSIPVTFNSNTGIEYIYNNFNIREYLLKTKPVLLNKTKREISDYIGQVDFKLTLKAVLPPNDYVNIVLQIYDFDRNRWNTINYDSVSFYEKDYDFSIGYLNDYLNDDLNMFTRLQVYGYDDEVTLDINYLDMVFYHYEPGVYTIHPYTPVVKLYDEIQSMFYVEAYKVFSPTNRDIISQPSYKKVQYIKVTDNKSIDLNPQEIYGNSKYLTDTETVNSYINNLEHSIIISSYSSIEEKYIQVYNVDTDKHNLIEKIYKFNGVRTDIQDFKIEVTHAPNPDLYIMISEDGKNWETVTKIDYSKDNEVETTISNKVVDLYGLKFVNYSDITPMSEVLLSSINTIPIRDLIGEKNVSTMPRGYFNALWTDIDTEYSVKMDTLKVINDTDNGIIDSSSGEIVKATTLDVNTYTSLDDINYSKLKYVEDLRLGSSRTLDELSDFQFTDSSYYVDNNPKVNFFETEISLTPKETVNLLRDSGISQTVSYTGGAKYELDQPIISGHRYKITILGELLPEVTTVNVVNTNTDMSEVIFYPTEINKSHGLLEKEFTAKTTSIRKNENIKIYTDANINEALKIKKISLVEIE
ncbi:hypothetical protein Terranova_115 [Staphylococcus phage Terranova]|nr:hypothetical protein Terranova_115 [Staphylococcus phage Terranova]